MLIIFCLFLFGLDFALKWYTSHYIPLMSWSSLTYPYGGVPVFQDFFGVDCSLNYVINKGAAWGAFAQFQKQLLYLRFFIMGGLLLYIFLACLPFIKRFALLLILTGAIGNIVDFFMYHHVVDMFYFRFWGYSFPVFNLADAAIFLGVAILLLQSLFKACCKQQMRIL